MDRESALLSTWDCGGSENRVEDEGNSSESCLGIPTDNVDAAPRLRFCHDVGGIAVRLRFWDGFAGWPFASLEKERERGCGCEREARGPVLIDDADDWRERDRCESRLVRGDGASSSSLYRHGEKETIRGNDGRQERIVH